MNYFLGVFTGDGSISSNNRGQLKWLSVDDCWIERVTEILREIYGETIRSGRYISKGFVTKEYILMYSWDKQLKEFLLSHGVLPRKSFLDTLVMPDKGYEWFFVRGFLDSDGTVLSCKKGNHIKWYGTKRQIFWLRDFFEGQRILSTIQIRMQKSGRELYELWVSRQYDIESIKRYLPDTEYVLKRKSVKIKELKDKRKRQLKEGFFGVYRGKEHWLTSVLIKGKQVFCIFKDEILAAKAADCLFYIRGKSRCNFPEISVFEKWKELGEKNREKITTCLQRFSMPELVDMLVI
jgi:hypothetical protein